MNVKSILESSKIEQYLSSKFRAYNVDIYTTDKFIIIEIPCLYNAKKSMEKLILSVEKDKNKIEITETTPTHIDGILSIKNKTYKIRMIKSDLDF